MEPSLTHAHIIWYDELDSTNNELRRRLEGLDNLSIIAAKSQTVGRGQGDHRWSSEPGLNLTFSLLLRFEGCMVPARDAGLINGIITPVIQEFLAEEGVDSWVKLPNDIWVGDRKICGILIENILHGEYLGETIVGTGLNLNQTVWPQELPNPVSLKELTGREYPLEASLERILILCKKNWEKFRIPSERQ